MDEGIIGVGPRVLVRSMVEADRAAYLAMRRASREHLRPWEPIPPSGLDLESDEAFDRELARVCSETDRRWAVCLAGTLELVGRVSMSAIERGPFQNGRLGYWTGAPHAGHGYMGDAIGLVVAHAFVAMGLHRVCANIMPTNAASRRVLERNGFVCEGLSEKYLQIAGAWADHERWALTVERWGAIGVGAENI